MPFKRKKRQWRIFRAEFEIHKKHKISTNALFKKNINPLHYLALYNVKKCRVIKSKNVRIVQEHIQLQKVLPLFRQITKNAKSCCKTYDKDNLDIFKKLDWVIPDDFFGTNKHRRLFYTYVKKILSRSAHECVYTKSIVHGYKFKKIPWLDQFNNNARLWRRYLYKGALWLLNKIVLPIINFFYYSLKVGQTHEIRYVPMHLWRSYEAKVLNHLMKQKFIAEVEKTYCKKDRGILRVIPKNGLSDTSNFRMILRNSEKWNGHSRKKCLSLIYGYARKLSLTETCDFYKSWVNYLNRIENQKIYAVKVDVSDAFGNVNIEYLIDIIKGIREFSVPFKTSIANHINEQFIKFSSQKIGKIYKWNHGLLQGDHLSGALCELYMSYLDSIYLSQFYKRNCLVHRFVDDYLFCSTNKDDIERFIDKISTAYILNNSKTQSNLKPYNNVEIEYCGKLLNINTWEIKGLYKFPKDTALRYRFKLWNMNFPLEEEGFLARAMYFPYNNNHFGNIELNTVFNSEKTVLQNFFESMIFLAFKFDAAVMAIYDARRIPLYGQALSNTVWHYSCKVLKKIKILAGSKYTGSIKFEKLVNIGYRAFLLVLIRRNTKYTEIIKEIKTKLKRIYASNYNPNSFKVLPKCFTTLSMTRSVNILTK